MRPRINPLPRLMRGRVICLEAERLVCAAVEKNSEMKTPEIWPQDDGQPVSCVEKLKVLEENWQEVQDVLRDAFEDAVLMGVSEQVMRDRLADLVTALVSPRQGSGA